MNLNRKTVIMNVKGMPVASIQRGNKNDRIMIRMIAINKKKAKIKTRVTIIMRRISDE